MIIHRLYLGTWFPRTSMHLREVFNFLHQRRAVHGLDQKKIERLHANLGVTSSELHEEHYFDFVVAQLGGKKFFLTEDGILLLKDDRMLEPHNGEFVRRQLELSEFYLQKLGPTIDYLFSRGAPVPRNLVELKTVTPYIAVVSGATSEDVAKLYKSINEAEVSVVRSDELNIHHSPTLTVLAVKNNESDFEKIEAFIRHDVFFREFEFQLEDYLFLHRTYWDEISKIRDTRGLRYKDFSNIRKKLMDLRRSITYVSARLEQMDDILNERSKTVSQGERIFLQQLGFHRFESLESSVNYTRRLWSMNLKQLDGTVTLLSTLYEENTQRELAVLKTLTIATAVTGFFGMNIPFPWNLEWASLRHDSYAVATIAIGGSIIASLVLHYLLKNRRFKITEKK